MRIPEQSPAVAQEWTVDSVTELRIHGVGGSSPRDVLGAIEIRRVAGDAEAGFYRRAYDIGDDIGIADSVASDGDRTAVRPEAYSWGSLTSGAAARAFWLLLLPFSLANLAGWARPWRAPTRLIQAHRLPRLVEWLLLATCRLMALSLTVTLILATAGVAMNLLAWQCLVPGTRCSDAISYLGFLDNGWFSSPGPRLMITALLPVVVLAVLWLLAASTWRRYEQFDAATSHTGEGLEAAEFWRGQHVVGRLRTVHVSAALAVIAALLCYAPLRADLREDHAYAACGWAIAVLCAVVLAACVAALLAPTISAAGSTNPLLNWVLRLLRPLAVLSLLAGGVYVCLSRPDWSVGGTLPGFNAAVSGVFLGQLGAVVLLLITAVALHRVATRGRGAADGTVHTNTNTAHATSAPNWAPVWFATPLLALLAMLVGTVFSAGVTYRMADWLNRGAATSDTTRLLAPPSPYQWAAFGVPFALIAALVVFVAIRVWLRPLLVRRSRGTTDADFPGGRDIDPQRARTVDAAIGDAAVTDAVPRSAALLLPVAVVLTLAFGVAVAFGVTPRDLVVEDGTSADLLTTVIGTGTWLIGAAVAALLAVGVQAYRTPRLRRMVGMLWDIATFWPRSTHPLAPPCYAERVVPELVIRAGWHAEHGGVVLAGHSQGSVLAAAVVLQLPPGARPGTALLTYGSPLRRLYGRYFPAYFGPDTMHRITELCRWRNLWRSTDPVGGPVGVAGVDRRLIDPAGLRPVPGDTVAPPIRAHSEYSADSAYSEHVTCLSQQIDEPRV